MGRSAPLRTVGSVSQALGALPLALAIGVLLAPLASGADGGIDTNTLHLQGPRSTGGMLLPSSHVLAPGGWDLSLTYGHEGGVVRSRIPTETIRGGDRFREIHWIEDRDLMLLQLAVSPLDRLEILAGVPMLLRQEVSSDPGLEPLSSGSSTFGDLRLGLRYGLWSFGGWGANLQGGLLLPTGGSDYGMGDSRARADLAGSIGFRSDDGWAAHLHLGHLMGQQLSLGDQIFGDTAYGGLLLQYRHAVGEQQLQWSVEAVMASVVAGAESTREPERESLELLAGARYFFDAVYFDLGGGWGALDAGRTPSWRLLASIGASGLWERAPAPAPAPREVVYLPAPTAPQQVAPPSERSEPPEDPRQTYRAIAIEERSIFFDVGKAELDELAQSLLRDIALTLLASERRLVITGYADDQGTSDRNQELSLRRAERVRAALLDAGVGKDRLDVVGAGDTSPVAQSTPFGRSINRRVAFTWVD